MQLEEIRDIIRLTRVYHTVADHSLDLKNLYFEKSLFGEFFRNIVDTPIQKDEEMAEKIYHDRHPGSKYMKLKSSFASSALNSLNFLDLRKEDISESTRAFYKCNKNLFFISVLLRSGRRNAAIPLVRRTLLLTEKYEFYSISATLYEHLRSHSLLLGNKKEYEKWVAALHRATELHQSEGNMRTLDHRLRIHSTRSLYIDESLKEQAEEAMNICKRELERNDTFENRQTYYRLKYMYNQYAGSPSKSNDACNEALTYLKLMPLLSTDQHFGEFELYKLENYLLSRDYKNGERSASECAKYYRNGSNLWFKYKEEQLLLSMQTLNFGHALEIFIECTTHQRYSSQIEHQGERWKIYQLYLDYLELDRINLGRSKKTTLFRQKKYRVMLSEYPNYSTDKRGFNVALLLLNILLHLESGKYDEVIVRTEALASYKTRHLKKENSQESAILLKLIQRMVEYDFDFEVISKKSVSLEKKLAETMPSLGEILECVQILPPMWIWQKMKRAIEARK
jgi:hypothetical protein